MVIVDEQEVKHRMAAEFNRAMVSDLTDSRLHGEEFAQAVEAVCAGAEGTSAWHMVHLVGDAMRSRELGGLCLDTGFARSVLERVAAESFEARLDDSTRQLALATDGSTPARLDWRLRPANGWNWSLVAGVGAMGVALALVLSLGGIWSFGDQGERMVRGGRVAERLVPLLATASAPAAGDAPTAVVAAAPPTGQTAPAVMIRDPHLDELLAAHRQMGGTSALQKPAGFFRNAAHLEEGSR